MPASDYPSRITLIGFFVQEQDAGNLEKREKFRQELFDRYNRHIVDACAVATPPFEASEEARAIIAVMAEHAPGSAAGVRARRAVAAYLEHRGR